MTDAKGAGEGPYVLGDELKTNVWRRTLETEAHVKIANLAYAEGRKSRDVLRHEIERMMSCVGEEDFEILSEVIRADDGWNNCGQSME